MRKAIVNARIITPLEVIPWGTVLIEGSRIIRVIKGKRKVPANAELIDAGGRIVCPGFIDLHLQGGGGADVADGTPEAINCVSSTHARYGTTSFLATTTIYSGKNISRENPHIKPIVRMVGRGIAGAKILGIHLEGPFINPKSRAMIEKDCLQKPGIRKLKKIIKLCDGKLKMMTIAPELKGSLELIRELKKCRIIASLGHTDAGCEEAMDGIKAGISHSTHVFNAMRGLHHREPGTAGACLDSDISVQLIADLVHVHPAIVRLIIKTKGTENVALITDAVKFAGMPDGIFSTTIHGKTKRRFEVSKGIVMGKGGRLAGTAFTFNRIVHNAAGIGFSLQGAVRMATLTPASVLGLENRKGIIAPGKDADLIIIDEKVNVYLTMVGGKVVWKSPRSQKRKKKKEKESIN